MPSYEALKNKQTELIRKALDGSVFVADILADPIAFLTSYAASSTAGSVTGSSDAVNIVTGGNLVLSVDGAAPVTIALASSDTPAQVVTKIEAGSVAEADVSGGEIVISSPTTGSSSSVRVVSGTGSVLANLFLAADQEGFGVTEGVSLNTLPAGYDDLGWLSTDGAQFARDVASSEVTSWGSVTPTRTDITNDTTTLTVVAQETKLLTIGLATGADLSAAVADPDTGEIRVSKPARAKSKVYRALSVAVDSGDAGEIYIARFLPRARVSNYSEQAFGQSDDPITWGVTLTGEVDSDLGYSEQWLFGGEGWKAILEDMGFPAL